MDDPLMLSDEIWMPGYTESILCLDSFRAHISASTDGKLRTNNVHASVIPGGCTYILQCLLEQAFQITGIHAKQDKDNPIGKIPSPSRQLIVNWVDGRI